MLTGKILLTTLLLLSSGFSFAADKEAGKEKEFGGMKRGFFSTPKSSKSTPPSMSIVDQPAREQHLPLESLQNTQNTETSIWTLPQIYTAKARASVYINMDPRFLSAQQLETYFTGLTSSSLPEQNKACASQSSFHYYLAFKTLMNEKMSQLLRSMSQERDIPDSQAFIIQAMDHQVISTRMKYMLSLDGQRRDEFEKAFITPGSDLRQGELIIKDKYWPNSTRLKKPTLKYYLESTSQGQKIYHLYFAGTDYIELARQGRTTDTGKLKRTYGMGDLQYLESVTPYILHESCYILDEKGQHISTPGLVLMKGGIFAEDCSVAVYDCHPFLDQMFLFSKETFTFPSHNEIIDPSHQRIIDQFGGLEILAQQKFIFLPDLQEQEDISTLDAEFILPYFYYLRQESSLKETLEDKGTPDTSDALTQVIQVLEEIIIEAEDEIQAPQISQEKPVLIAFQPPKAKGKNKPISQQKKKSRSAPVVSHKQGKIVDEEGNKRIAKKKKLENLRLRILKKTEDQKWFNTSEATEILEQLTKGLDTVGIKEMGEERIRGSHKGIGIIDSEGITSTTFGIARRPQKEGYRLGTLKSIINQRVEQVSKLLQSKIINKNSL